MWNAEIRQKIIDELKEEFSSIEIETKAFENHSYVDSIYTPSISTNMFKPVTNVPNYYETTINRTRMIQGIPVHTIAFADTLEPKNIKFAYDTAPVVHTTLSAKEEIYDITNLLSNNSGVEIPLTPEKRGVALAKKNTWKEILFSDIDWNQTAQSIKKFCNKQIRFGKISN